KVSSGVTLVGCGVAARMALPSSSSIMRLGMVIGVVMLVSSPMPAGGPATLLTMTTAIAPLAWAFLTLVLKVQLPRLMSAIRPVRSSVIAVQPSSGVVAWRSAVIGEGTPGPKTALAAGLVPATLEVGFT